MVRSFLTRGLMARLVVGAIALGAGLAVAAGAPPPPPPPPPDPAVDAAVGDPPKPTPTHKNYAKKDYTAVADLYVGRAQKVFGDITSMRTEAQGDDDTIKYDCLSEVLWRLKGIVEVAEASRDRLREALQAKDDAEAARHLDNVLAMSAAADKAMEDAQRCVGADASTSMGTLDMEITGGSRFDPYYQDESFFADPAQTLIDGGKGLDDDRPPPASPVF